MKMECTICELIAREERLTKCDYNSKEEILCVECVKSLFDPDFYLGKEVKMVSRYQGK